MPSTEPNITCPVDERFHRNRGKCGFRCVAHETIEIAVRIEIRVSVLVWNHAVKRISGLVHLKASREYPCEFSGRDAKHGTVEWHVRACRTVTRPGTVRFQLDICVHAGILMIWLHYIRQRHGSGMIICYHWIHWWTQTRHSNISMMRGDTVNNSMNDLMIMIQPSSYWTSVELSHIMISSLLRYHISDVVFDGWIHGEHIMNYNHGIHYAYAL